MLNALFDLCKNTINVNIDKTLISIIFKDEIRQYIIDLNQKGQLGKGENSFGDPLGTYSYRTEIITKGRKKAGDPITLYDTGKFYNSFDVVVYSDNSFSIEANTIKGETDLASSKRYGRGILGLSEESKQELIDKILPEIIKKIRIQMQGKNV